MMIQIRKIIFFSLIFCSTFAIGQNSDDPILFTVDDTKVPLSEFKYIYNKTNGDKADYSEASIKDYLELYTNFKLKVQRARALQLDTVPTLNMELAGYRKQLANTYLMDRQVMEKLMKEAYDRLQEDVSISHILINLSENASEEEEKRVLNQLNVLKKDLESGASFEESAMRISQDPSVKRNKGEIGYITGLQLPGFYNIESAAYNTPVGKVSDPVKTSLGYHLVRVNDRRPARGEIEVAHILVRVNDKSQEAAAQAKINKIYAELEKGGDFGKIAKAQSEDKSSVPNGGYLGFFGINKYEASFEEAAFGLKNDGDYSRPVHSKVGWHILKRISRKPIDTYDNLKRRLKIKVKNDSRFNIVQEQLVGSIKETANYTEIEGAKESLFKQLGESFFTPQWQAPTKGLTPNLFTLGGQSVATKDFINFLSNSTNQRFRAAKRGNLKTVFNTLYDKFVGVKCIEYEESQLENKYPEFKALMREYEEGILLFEVTKQLVWDKASQDSIGLDNFYQKNKNNYSWDKRAKATIYTLPNDNIKLIEQIRKLAKKKSPDAVIAAIPDGADIITYKSGVYEPKQNDLVDAVKWKKKTVGDLRVIDDKATFVKIESVLKPKPKTLAESRGYVVSDYQDFLEKNWIKDLKNSYKVTVNQDVLNQLIKK